MKNTASNLRLYLILHASLLLSSLSGVCSKQAALAGSRRGTLLWYAGVLLLMGIYALIWQQILKRLPLTVAYANKPVGLVWGMVWGKLLFRETITWRMILAAGIIFAGILLVVTSDE